MNSLLLIMGVLAQQSAELPDTTVSSNELEELVIIAKKEVIKSDGASLTYDLSEDDSTNGLTLLEALRKVPLVSVDGQDNIRINGDSNFKIYVNGKEDPMMEANYSQIFKSMPADAVMKIEVITEPGSKYDAEGTGGILNLTTRKSQRNDGYSGSTSVSLSNRDFFFSLLGRMKVDKISADANLVYSSNTFSDQKNHQTITTLDQASENLHRQQTHQQQHIGYKFSNASLNGSWDINESNFFTFGGSFMNLNAKVKNIDLNTIMFSRNEETIWKYHQTATGRLKNLSANANASFQHNFGNPNHYLVVSWMFAFGRNPFDLLTNTTSVKDYLIPYPWKRDYNTDYTRENTFQLDYSNPLDGDKHKIETGVKAIIRHNSAIGYNSTGERLESLSIEDESNINLTQRQDVYALYAAYTGNFNQITTVGGLRYEFTRMELKNHIVVKDGFKHYLNDIVPNAAIAYHFSSASNLRLAYQMRITRPSLDQMNPHRMHIGSFIQEGNPDLKSEKSNKITLTYTNFSRIMGGNISFDYKFVNNAIANYLYFTKEDDGQIIIHQTSDNIGIRHELGLGGFYNIAISQKMNISMNGRVAYVKMYSTSLNLKNHGWTGNYGIDWSYSAPGEVKFSAYGGQSLRNLLLQGYYSGWYYYGIGISRSFLKDSLLLSLSAANFLQNNMNFKSFTQSGSQSSSLEVKNFNWKIGLSLTWNFGNLKSQTKKTNIQIENNDITTSGSKGGIGI